MNEVRYHVTLLSFVLFFAFWITFWAILDHDQYFGIWGHAWRYAVRALPFIILCMASYDDWKGRISLALVFAAWFWLQFDVMLNFSRGMEWYYLGETAFFDRIFPSFAWQFVVKLVLLFGSLGWWIREETK